MQTLKFSGVHSVLLPFDCIFIRYVFKEFVYELSVCVRNDFLASSASIVSSSCKRGPLINKEFLTVISLSDIIYVSGSSQSDHSNMVT